MGCSGRCKNWISYPFVGWILNVHDCTVKIHADVIFFPKKLTAHVHLMPVPTTGTFLINCEGVKYGCSGIRYAASSQWWQRESRIGSAEQGIATLTEEIAAVEINIKNLDKAATEVINQRKGEHKEFWNKWHHTLLPRSICKEIRREHTIRSSVLPWEAYRAHPPPSYWSRRCIPYQLWRCQVCFLWKLEVISKTAFSTMVLTVFSQDRKFECCVRPIIQIYRCCGEDI